MELASHVMLPSLLCPCELCDQHRFESRLIEHYSVFALLLWLLPGFDGVAKWIKCLCLLRERISEISGLVTPGK